MIKALNIKHMARLLMLALAVCVLLSACSGSTDGNADLQRTALGETSTGETGMSLAKEQTSCWQTGILELMYSQMGKMALGMYTQITEGALGLMMVAFAVWFSFRLMRHLSSFQAENAAETWNEVLKQLLLCFVCGMIAESSQNIIWILNHVIFPIYYAFLEFGSEMMNAAIAGDASNKGDFYFLGELVQMNQTVSCKAGDLTLSEDLTSFPQAPLELLECMTCALDQRLAPGFGISLSVLWDVGFMAFFIGMCIFLIFLFIRIAFIFYLVDTLFRFTIMVAILPILVMAYAFKYTRSWTSHGFYAIINSAAYMMFISIMIAVSLLTLEEVMRMKDFGLSFDSVSEFKESFKQLGVTLLCLLLLAFLIVSTMGIAKELTSQLVGGNADSNFQKRGGKAAAMFGKTLVVGALALLTAGVGKVAMRFATVRNAKSKWDNTIGKVAGAVSSFTGRGGRGGFSGGFKSAYQKGRDAGDKKEGGGDE